MNWVPHLLAPGTAAIAAAVAVPSLLVLYFLKLRRREMPVSSTFLWRKAVQDLQVNAPFQRLRRNLLLLLQMLALLALLFALARPVSNYTPGAGKLSVILIDRSASMKAADGGPGGRTRLDEAKRLARDLVDGMDKGGQASVIAFDDTAEVVQTFTGDAATLRRAIDGIVGTDRPTRLKQAYQLAGAQAVYIPEQNRANVKPTVYLFSDGRAVDEGDLGLDGDLKFTPVGTDASANLAVVSLDAKRNYDNPAQVQVFARLANYGPKPAAADVRLTVDGETKQVASVSLKPARWSDAGWVKAHPGEADESYAAKDSVQFTFDMPAAGVVKVEQTNHYGDLLAADDAASVVVPPPKTLSVLLVSEDRSDPYLERAFESQRLRNAQEMSGEDYEEKQPHEFDVILFDRHYPTYLPPSGSFVYFGCAPTAGKLRVNQTDGKYDTVDATTVLDWQRDHPILRHLAVSDIFAAQMLKLVVPPEAQVLIDGVKGPMVVLYRQPRGTDLVVAFDLLQSNWPLHRVSFPLFIHYALQYLALGSDMAVRASVAPGDTPRVPRVAVDHLPAGTTSVRVSGPGGTRDVPVPATGDLVLPAMNTVGLYRTTPPVPGFEQVAVNLLSETESNLVPVETPPGNVAQQSAAAHASLGKSRVELWWWLVACGAVPLLLVEWWVYTRRVHL